MRLFVILALVAAAIIGWTGYWFYAANQVERGIADWIDRQAKRGVQASHEGLTVGGYPFRVRVDIVRPRISAPDRPEQPFWRAENLRAVGHPWNPRHIIIDLTGRHDFGALVEGERMQWRLTTTQAMASYHAGPDGRLERLSTDLTNAVLSQNASALLKSARTQVHLRPSSTTDDLVDLAFSLNNAELGWRVPDNFGQLVEGARLQITVTGRPTSGSLPQALAAWRDGGGTLEVQAVELDWGRLSLRGEGTLALDEAMRPMGAMTTRLKGFELLVEAARDDGQMSAGAAVAANAALGLLAAANGGMLSVPVRLQNGEAFLGPARIARLAPLLPPP